MPPRARRARSSPWPTAGSSLGSDTLKPLVRSRIGSVVSCGRSCTSACGTRNGGRRCAGLADPDAEDDSHVTRARLSRRTGNLTAATRSAHCSTRRGRTAPPAGCSAAPFSSQCCWRPRTRIRPPRSWPVNAGDVPRRSPRQQRTHLLRGLVHPTCVGDPRGVKGWRGRQRRHGRPPLCAAFGCR